MRLSSMMAATQWWEVRCRTCVARWRWSCDGDTMWSEVESVIWIWCDLKLKLKMNVDVMATNAISWRCGMDMKVWYMWWWWFMSSSMNALRNRRTFELETEACCDCLNCHCANNWTGSKIENKQVKRTLDDEFEGQEEVEVRRRTKGLRSTFKGPVVVFNLLKVWWCFLLFFLKVQWCVPLSCLEVRWSFPFSCLKVLLSFRKVWWCAPVLGPVVFLLFVRKVWWCIPVMVFPLSRLKVQRCFFYLFERPGGVIL